MALLAVCLSLLWMLGLGGAAQAADPIVAGVGDMACAPTDSGYNGGAGTSMRCRQKYVSDLLVSPNAAPAALLDLGDNQYANGELANYQSVYHPSFGRSNAIVYPSIGNAEYNTANAQGFFDYFASTNVTSRIIGTGGGDTSRFSSGGYYSFSIGAWHMIALNSNCGDIGGCGLGSPQEVWLKNDLAAHPNSCTLAYWHHPRWNSGSLGNDGTTAAFWTDLYNARADIVLNGHGNHHYERHLPQTAAAVPDAANGVREFIVSTGGESHGTPPGTPGDPNTMQVADYTSYGVLKLTLHPLSYDWQFVPAAGGSFTDSGTGTCHASAPARPSVPSLSATGDNNAVHLSWSAPSDGGAAITSYKIYRGTAAGGETLLKSVGNVTTSDDTTAANGTKYYYRVSAVNSVGEGPQSNEVSVTPAPPPPPAPFPSTGVLDSFARAAGPLGTNWQSPALQDPGTVSIAASGLTKSGSGAGSATWNTAFGADQEAYLTVPTLPAAGTFLQLAGRVSNQTANNPSCFFLRVTPSNSTWDIRQKLDGAASTSLSTFSAPLAAGDSVGMRIAGSTITIYRKPGAGAWTAVGTATNTAITAGGFISYTLGDTTIRGGAFGGGNVTTTQAPGAPALSATAADGSVHLSWTAASNGGSAITGYNVYRGTAAGAETLLQSTGNVTAIDDAAVVNGTRYFYRVAAVNSIGEGAQSNEVSTTPTSRLSLSDVSVLEGNSGQTDLAFTASLSNPSAQTVTVGYSTLDGTATSGGSDYGPATGTLSFDPGQTAKTVIVKAGGDTGFEPDEAFFLKLAGAANATISDDTGVGTIRNDDVQPAIAVSDVARTEGNSGATAYTFTVSLSNQSYQSVTISRQTQDGTATTADADYTAVGPAVITFAPGETQKQVTVNVNGDAKFEPAEDFTLKLSGSANATVADDTGLGTVQNDDAQPQISVNDVAQPEGNSGVTGLTFTVSLSNPSYQAVTFSRQTNDGTATIADSDYTPLSAFVRTIPAGQTQTTMTVDATGDTKFELSETFAVNLSAPGNATIADGAGAGTIQNDDGLPALAVDDVSHPEGNSGSTGHTFTVTLSNPSQQTVTVSRQTQDGTATSADGDYGALAAATLTFLPGETQKQVTVDALGDTKFEPAEDLKLKLSSAVNATIADDTGVGTIQNDDGQPAISVDDVSQNEGNSGITGYTLTVSLSNPSYQSVTVSRQTQDGSATIADSDYTALGSAVVTFAPGETQKPVTVNARGDTSFEPDEAFSLVLTGPVNAAILDATGQATIRNDDTQPTLSVNDVSAPEGDSGQTDLTFTTSLSNPSAQTVSVDYHTEDGTATAAGSDYVQAAGTLTFTPGQTAKTVTLKANGDVMFEPDEDFSLVLSAPANATILDGTAVGTIQNDDAQPRLSVNDVSQAEGDSGQADFGFTVSLSTPTAQTVTVDYLTEDGTATTAGADYELAAGTLTFNPGQVSKTVTVTADGDTNVEPDETFTLRLSSSSNATILDATGVGTIQNDDLPIDLSVADVSHAEGDAGQKDYDFSVSLSRQSGQAVSVAFATADATATIADSDYKQTTGTLTFDPGETSKTVTVKVNGDGGFEPDESFHLDLSNAAGATIADGTGVGTITNDDFPGYARPRGASPTQASLVLSYKECTTPDATHGGPLQPNGSCTGSAQASPYLTVGTPDANGAAAAFIGSVRLTSCAAPACPSSDVGITATLSDVRCQVGVATCELPGGLAGADYTGELGLTVPVRMTDRNNFADSGGPAGPGTVEDVSIPATIPCSATADTLTGARCDVATSMNALTAGSVTAGMRTIWELGRIEVDDAGPDGLVSTSEDAAPFAVQGVFAP